MKYVCTESGAKDEKIFLDNRRPASSVVGSDHRFARAFRFAARKKAYYG
jgi:hypothetical protein